MNVVSWFVRFVLLVAGLGMAGGAVWLGGVIATLVVSVSTTSDQSVVGILMDRLPISLAVGVVSVIFWGILFKELLEHVEYEEKFDTVWELFLLGINGSMFGLLFGVIATPFQAGGVSAWITPWDFLLIMGLAPVVHVAKYLVLDASDLLNRQCA